MPGIIDRTKGKLMRAREFHEFLGNDSLEKCIASLIQPLKTLVVYPDLIPSSFYWETLEDNEEVTNRGIIVLQGSITDDNYPTVNPIDQTPVWHIHYCNTHITLKSKIK